MADMWDEEGDLVLSQGGLDVFEMQDEAVVQAPVPGMDDERVEITFEKGALWV